MRIYKKLKSMALAILMLIFLVANVSYGDNSLEATANNGEYQTDDMERDDPQWTPDWNWTEDIEYPLYYLNGPENPEPTPLPYWSAYGPCSKFNVNIPGVRDIYPEDGWVLVYRDFGHPEILDDPETPENEYLARRSAQPPVIILYNKYRGILRVFYYYCFVQTYDHAFVTMKFLSPALASYAGNTFMASSENSCLDDYDPYRSDESIGGIEPFKWCYADFQILGYDPNIPDDATFDFHVYGINEGDVTLDGGIDLQQIFDEEGTVGNANGSSGPDAYNLGNEVFKAYDNAEKNIDALDKRSHPVNGKDKEKWWAPHLYRILHQGKPFTQLVPAYAAITSVIKAFAGGSNENHPIAMKFEGSLELNGSISETHDIGSFVLRVPGSATDHVDNLPFYDKPLGIFNLTTKPNIGYYGWMNTNNNYVAFCAATLHDDLEIIFNPEMLYKCSIKNIEAAFTKPGYIDSNGDLVNQGFPYGYWEYMDGEVGDDGYRDVDALRAHNPVTIQMNDNYYEYFIPTHIQRNIGLAIRITIDIPGDQSGDFTIVKEWDTPALTEEDIFPSPSTPSIPSLASPTISGTININTTLSGMVHLTGDVYIDNNKTLTLSPGTVVFIGDNSRLYVEDGSRIISNGSSENPVKFKSYGDIINGSIHIRSITESEFDNTIFMGPGISLSLNTAKANFEYCTMKNMQFTGISISGSEVTLDHCLIENNGTVGYTHIWGGVSVYNGSILNMTYCTIRNNIGSGVYINGNLGYDMPVYAKMSRNSIYGNGKAGIELNNAEIGSALYGHSYLRNVVDNNGTYGIHLKDNAKVWFGENSTTRYCAFNRISNNGSYEIFLDSNDPETNICLSKEITKGEFVGWYNDIFDSVNGGVLIKSELIPGGSTGVGGDSVDPNGPGNSDPYTFNNSSSGSTNQNQYVMDKEEEPNSLGARVILAVNNYWGNSKGLLKGMTEGCIVKTYGLYQSSSRSIDHDTGETLPGWGSGLNLTTVPIYKEIPQLEPVEEILPEEFSLNQSYPNPFNPTTNISYTLPRASNVKISVFNINGQLVKTLSEGHHAAGEHLVTFDGSALSSGVYFVFMKADNFSTSQKIILMK